MLKRFLKIFKALNSNSHPGEIAHAISIALLMGFLPKDNVTWYIFTFFFLFIRINKGVFALFTLLFSILSQFLDTLFDSIGYQILTFTPLEPFFAKLLEIPFVSFTKFNNTIVMGALILGLILYIPFYFLTRGFLKLWRNKLTPFIRKTKLIQYISKLKLIKKIGDTYVSLN